MHRTLPTECREALRPTITFQYIRTNATQRRTIHLFIQSLQNLHPCWSFVESYSFIMQSWDGLLPSHWHPASSEIHAPMHASAWSQGDVDPTAAMAFVAAVLFLVVRVAQACEVVGETAGWRRDVVVLRRGRYECWGRGFVFESWWVE